MNEHRRKFSYESAQAYLAMEPEMDTCRLAERIWTTTDGLCRTIFIEADNSIIAFDTFGTPGKARAYKRSIEASVPGKTVRTIIYSHDHLDHAGFAADLAADAVIIADEMCAKVIKLRQADGQSQVTRVISGKENTLYIDGTAITLLNPGPIHGTGNISAFFPDQKILFSSDTILANAKYGFLPDYHLCNFVKYMRDFLELDWDTFVPGRFDLTDRRGFEKGCEFIEAVQTESQNAFAEFVPIWAYEPMQTYVGDKLRERFGEMEGYEEHIGMMSLRIVHHYLMGGWGLEDTPNPGYVLANTNQ